MPSSQDPPQSLGLPKPCTTIYAHADGSKCHRPDMHSQAYTGRVRVETPKYSSRPALAPSWSLVYIARADGTAHLHGGENSSMRTQGTLSKREEWKSERMSACINVVLDLTLHCVALFHPNHPLALHFGQISRLGYIHYQHPLFHPWS